MQVFDETPDDFRRLIELDFGQLPNSTALEHALIDWLHYRARRVPQRPRTVTFSSEAEAAADRFPAINDIVRELSNGTDVSPWLHDLVRTRKHDPFADMMFNDWQILHFHLGRVFIAPNKVKRSGPLLFAYMKADLAVLLDVQPHGSWTMRNLLRVLVRTSPEVMDRFHLKTVLGLEREVTDQEYATLRSKGVSTMFTIDGRVYCPPGHGIASSRHATRIVVYCDQIRRAIRHISESILRNNLPLDLSKAIYGNLSLAVRIGVALQPTGELTFYDKNRSLVLHQLGCIE